MQSAAIGQPNGHPAQRRVLVVEDEVLIRMLLTDALRERGLDVVEAANADEALILMDCAMPIDLVLTDVAMRGSIDGLGLARAIRASGPALKIVVVSGCLPAGAPPELADAFFSKPYVLADLVQRVVNLLAEPPA